MKKLAGILALSALALSAAPAAADKPEVPEAVQKLQRLVGTWKAKGKLKMGADAADVTATWTCVSIAAGNGIRCGLQLKGIPGMALYQETDLMGYDPGDGLVHWYSVTNAGETHDHKGSWDGENLQVTFTGPKGGELYNECITIKFDGKNRFRLVAVVFEGHKPGPTFDLTATR